MAPVVLKRRGALHDHETDVALRRIRALGSEETDGRTPEEPKEVLLLGDWKRTEGTQEVVVSHADRDAPRRHGGDGRWNRVARRIDAADLVGDTPRALRGRGPLPGGIRAVQKEHALNHGGRRSHFARGADMDGRASPRAGTALHAPYPR